MKKSIIIFFCVSFVLFCSACVNFHPIRITGDLESETPKMRIVISDDPTKFGNDGNLTHEDGSVVKIVFSSSHGDFIIYEFQEDGQYGLNSTILYEGKCRQKGDTIILTIEDGSKIILKKVEDMTDLSTDATVRTDRGRFYVHGVTIKATNISWKGHRTVPCPHKVLIKMQIPSKQTKTIIKSLL